MSRGSLDEVVLKAIAEQLPEINDLELTVHNFSPDFLSIPFKLGSSVPAAAVCLQDLANTLSEARFALQEALAYKSWYLDKVMPKNETLAVFFMRFFLDDIALRLYSGGEHLGEAIIDMLEIDRNQLAPFFKKKGNRRQAVTNYLRKHKSDHPITAVVSGLADSPEWSKAIQYRNAWVHGQPPLVKGLGIVYRRGQRWKISEDGKQWSLGLGGGDEPAYSTDDLMGFIRPALFELIEASKKAVQIYTAILRGRGVNIGEDPVAAQLNAAADARTKESQ